LASNGVICCSSNVVVFNFCVVLYQEGNVEYYPRLAE
jgi:hypothetical protein